MKTSKQIFLMLLPVLLLGALWWYKTDLNNHKFRLETFEATCGWGYRIYEGDKVFIQQESVPVLSGNKCFYSQQDAYLVGELVTNRLNNGQSPSLSKQDLDSLQLAEIEPTQGSSFIYFRSHEQIK